MNNDKEQPISPSTSASTGLTGIPQSIHCPASDVTQEDGYDELDRIAIEHFLDTLAEVALAVAARINQNGDRNES